MSGQPVFRRPGDVDRPGSGPNDDLGGRTVIGIANAMIRHAPIIVGLALLTASFAVVLAIVRPPEYTATSAVATRTGGGLDANLAMMASRFGVSMGSQEGLTLAFLSQLLHSRELLGDVAEETYTVPAEEGGGVRTGTLMDLLGVEGTAPIQRRNQAVGFLREGLEPTLRGDAGVIIIRSKAPIRELAEQVNAQIVGHLIDYSLRIRRERASAERRFLAERVREVEQELTGAESAVTEFLAGNRQYQGSPELVQELSVLRRRVDTHQQVYLTLTTALEQARIEEAKDVPPIVVLESPEGTAGRTDLGLIMSALLGAIAGFVVAIVIVVVIEYAGQVRRRHPEEYAEMKRLLLQRGPFRWLDRRASRTG